MWLILFRRSILVQCSSVVDWSTELIGMQPKSESVNHQETQPQTVPANAIFSETWWCGVGYNPLNPAESRSIETNASSLRCNGCTESNEGQPLSNEGRTEEDDDSAKGSLNTASTLSGR